MTKISCTECRGRLGEVLAAEVAPVHDAQQRAVPSDLALLRANLSDLSLLHAHLDECADCARDLALLRATRETMRSFVAPPLPADLRERIRTQIEQEAILPEAASPEAAVLEAQSSEESTPAADGDAFPALQSRPSTYREASEIHDLWKSCVRFFRRPANTAWASGLALAACCLVLVARPRPENGAEPAPPDDITTHAPTFVQKAGPHAAPPNAAIQPKAAQPKAQPTPQTGPGAPLPALPPFSGAAPLPFLDDGPFAPPPPTWPETGKKETAPFVAPPAPHENKAGAAADRTAASSAPHMSTAPTGASSALSTPPRTALGSLDKASRENSTPLLTEPARQNRPVSPPVEHLARAKAQADGPSASSLSAARPTNGAFAMRAAAPATAEAPAVSLPPTIRRDPTPVKRFMTAQVKAPRVVGWGQVSVELSGDAHFEDGRQVRIVWRGTASAGETINVGFTVSAPRGEYSAHLTLQQVQNGDAQTVTTTAVPFTLH
jgi:hypothetical protein